jgi:paraquat-inducible protein B
MKTPSATLIGGFVLSALALVVAGLLFFGRDAFAEKRFAMVSFFDASVAGLQVGAPVTFRGVRVGEVKSIGLRVNAASGRTIVQVNMELVPQMVTVYGGRLPAGEDVVGALVERGLTAQLAMQSIVTGQLNVELRFRPEAEVARFGDASLPEVPTVPGDLEGLTRQLQALDIASLVQSLQRTAESADVLLSDPELKRGLRELPQVMASFKRSLDTIDREVAASSVALRQTLASMQTLAGSTDREIADTAAAMRETLAHADTALDAARALVDPRGHNAIEVRRAIDDLSVASARLRNLAERVDRDPSVLIRGR